MTDPELPRGRRARALAAVLCACTFGSLAASGALRGWVRPAFAAAAAEAAPSPTPTPEAQAESIFLHAKAVWRDRTEPAFVTWAVLARYRKGEKTWDNWWQASYRGSDQRLALHRIVILDDDLKRLKGVPIDLFGVKIADTNPDAEVTQVDDPYISPSSNFGVVARRGEELPRLQRDVEPPPVPERQEGPRDLFPAASPSPDPSGEPVPSQSELPEIGRVSALARDYRVHLAGIDHLRYGDAYHLTLEPIAEPNHYRLRDLWVKTDTFDTLELTVQGLYDGKPYDGAKWTVSYVPFGGRYYVGQVRTNDTMRFGITNVDEFEFDFVDYQFPAEIPNYTFEKKF